MTIKPGDMVMLKLAPWQCQQINDRRNSGGGSSANHAYGGEVVPALVVTVHGPDCFNGQAFIDGDFTLWVTSATRGTGDGEWQPIED